MSQELINFDGLASLLQRIYDCVLDVQTRQERIEHDVSSLKQEHVSLVANVTTINSAQADSFKKLVGQTTNVLTEIAQLKRNNTLQHERADNPSSETHYDNDHSESTSRPFAVTQLPSRNSKAAYLLHDSTIMTSSSPGTVRGPSIAPTDYTKNNTRSRDTADLSDSEDDMDLNEIPARPPQKKHDMALVKSSNSLLSAHSNAFTSSQAIKTPESPKNNKSSSSNTAIAAPEASDAAQETLTEPRQDALQQEKVTAIDRVLFRQDWFYAGKPGRLDDFCRKRIAEVEEQSSLARKRTARRVSDETANYMLDECENIEITFEPQKKRARNNTRRKSTGAALKPSTKHKKPLNTSTDLLVSDVARQNQLDKSLLRMAADEMSPWGITSHALPDMPTPAAQAANKPDTPELNKDLPARPAGQRQIAKTGLTGNPPRFQLSMAGQEPGFTTDDRSVQLMDQDQASDIAVANGKGPAKQAQLMDPYAMESDTEEARLRLLADFGARKELSPRKSSRVSRKKGNADMIA